MSCIFSAPKQSSGYAPDVKATFLALNERLHVFALVAVLLANKDDDDEIRMSNQMHIHSINFESKRANVQA